MLLYVVGLLAVGWTQGIEAAFAGGHLVLGVALFKVSQELRWAVLELAPATVLLALAEAGLARVIAPELAEQAFRIACSRFCCTYAVLLTLPTWMMVCVFPANTEVMQITVLMLAASVWGVRAAITSRLLFSADSLPGRQNLAFSFALLYHAYLIVLNLLHLSGTEFYTLPLAGALLLAGPGWQQLGVLAVVGPSLVLSLGSDPSHAIWAGMLGMALLLYGLGRNRGAYQAWGGLTLLSEISIQAFSVAITLPWQLWAAVAGVVLVGVGMTFEQRRLQMEAAGRTLRAKFAQW